MTNKFMNKVFKGLDAIDAAKNKVKKGAKWMSDKGKYVLNDLNSPNLTPTRFGRIFGYAAMTAILGGSLAALTFPNGLRHNVKIINGVEYAYNHNLEPSSQIAINHALDQTPKTAPEPQVFVTREDMFSERGRDEFLHLQNEFNETTTQNIPTANVTRTEFQTEKQNPSTTQVAYNPSNSAPQVEQTKNLAPIISSDNSLSITSEEGFWRDFVRDYEIDTYASHYNGSNTQLVRSETTTVAQSEQLVSQKKAVDKSIKSKTGNTLYSNTSKNLPSHPTVVNAQPVKKAQPKETYTSVQSTPVYDTSDSVVTSNSPSSLAQSYTNDTSTILDEIKETLSYTRDAMRIAEDLTSRVDVEENAYTTSQKDNIQTIQEETKIEQHSSKSQKSKYNKESTPSSKDQFKQGKNSLEQYANSPSNIETPTKKKSTFINYSSDNETSTYRSNKTGRIFYKDNRGRFASNSSKPGNLEVSLSK